MRPIFTTDIETVSAYIEETCSSLLFGHGIQLAFAFHLLLLSFSNTIAPVKQCWSLQGKYFQILSIIFHFTAFISSNYLSLNPNFQRISWIFVYMFSPSKNVISYTIMVPKKPFKFVELCFGVPAGRPFNFQRYCLGTSTILWLPAVRTAFSLIIT